MDMATEAGPGGTTGPGPSQATVDLLGVLAGAELTGGLGVAADGLAAPGRVRVAMARMAAERLRHYEAIAEHLEQLGRDPVETARPFEASIAQFHERTRPQDWLEGLVKAYVGDGIARDFYREVAAAVEPRTREVVEAVARPGEEEFVVQVVTDTIAVDPRVSGRLALWGRRVVGEALARAQAVVAERPGLAGLLVRRADGSDLAEAGRLFTRLTDAHDARMRRLGLTP